MKTKLPVTAEVQIRMPNKLLRVYKEIAALSGLTVEQVLVVTVAMKVVADKNQAKLP